MICFNLCFLAWLGIHHTSLLVTEDKDQGESGFHSRCFPSPVLSTVQFLWPLEGSLHGTNFPTATLECDHPSAWDSPWVLMRRWCPQPPEAYLSAWHSVDTQHRVSLLPWMNSQGGQRSALSLCLQMKALEVRGHVSCPRCITDKSQTYTQGQLPEEAASCF